MNLPTANFKYEYIKEYYDTENVEPPKEEPKKKKEDEVTNFTYEDIKHLY